MAAPTLEEFRTHCAREGSFLTDAHGFQLLSEPVAFNAFSRRFVRPDVEIQILGEGWGAAVSCVLVRGGNRVYLEQLLPVVAAPARQRTVRSQLELITTVLTRLREHCQDVLAGNLERVDEAIARFAQWQSQQAAEWGPERRARKEVDVACTAAGHAFKRGDFKKVIALLTPHEPKLSRRLIAMLHRSRASAG